MGYTNEHLRIAQSKIEGYEKISIKRNGEKFVTGDKHSICIVWNNIVGCNMLTRQAHHDYILYITNQKELPVGDKFSFIVDRTVLSEYELSI